MNEVRGREGQMMMMMMMMMMMTYRSVLGVP